MQSIDTRVRYMDAIQQVPDDAVAKGMTAAIYIHDLSPGGVERQCLVLARELQDRGVDITLVVHQVRGELVPLLPKGLPVVNLNGRRTLEDVFRLRRFLRDEKPSLLLANVDHNNIAAAMATAISGTSTRLVICQHNPLTSGFHDTVNWKHRTVPMFYRILAPHIDHAVAVSDGIADELVANAGLPRSKVTTIFNAVIGNDFDERAAEPVRHPWFQDRDRPVFVSAGRLVEMKDHRTLLRAFAQHLVHHPSRLMILGNGPMLGELQSLAQALEISEHVEMAGFVENPLPFMRAADAFVLSSRSEGFGNVIVEALGCGTPVVSTDCPHGPSDILADGEFGILVQPRSPEALAQALQDIIVQKARWPSAMLKARATKFSYGACADGYWRLFKSLVQ